MTQIDARPRVLDIAGLAGDDLILSIDLTPAPELQDGEWAGHVRRGKSSTSTLDADFTVDTTSVDPVAVVSLTGAQTRALADISLDPDTTSMLCKAGQYTGWYDIQVVHSGVTRTLARGKLFIDGDVTRTDLGS